MRLIVTTFTVILAVATVGTATALAAAGDLDLTFGTNGKVTTDMGSGYMEMVDDVVQQQGGKIVVVGRKWLDEATAETMLARYNADGSLDTSFDGDGKFTTGLVGEDIGTSTLALQQDGKVVVGGPVGVFEAVTPDYHFELVRYDTDFSPDTGFDGDGKLTVDFDGGDDIIRSVGIQQDGKIVAVGQSQSAGDHSFALNRYDSDGALDTDFGGDGRVTTPFGSSYDAAYSVKFQPGGKIVTLGVTTDGSDRNFALARYNSDGTLDTSFDVDGKQTTDLGSTDDSPGSLALQQDGKIVAVGGPALARYNIDGSLDTSFAGDGKSALDLRLLDIALQQDGKLVVAGSSREEGTLYYSDFAVARLKADGSLDTSFHGDGIATTDFRSPGYSFGALDVVRALTLQPDGKLVAAGNTSIDFALARYELTGESTPPPPPPLGGPPSTPPSTVLPPAPPAAPKSANANKAVTVTVDCPAGCTLKAKLKIGNKSSNLKDLQIAAGQTRASVKLPKSLQGEIKKARKKKKSTKVVLTVQLVNGAGSSTVTKIKIK